MKGLNIMPFTLNKLWEGCVLAGIAHAIMVAHYPLLASEHSWDGVNYSVQDLSGVRGTISFHHQYCTAAFRNDDNVHINRKNVDHLHFFHNAPSNIIELAKTETLQYLLEDVGGRALPLITAAFWGDSQSIVSIDSFDVLMTNGAGIIKTQLRDYESSIKAWKEYYSMENQQVKLLESIFKERMDSPDGLITLFKSDIDCIGCDDSEGLHESAESFLEMGISWAV